MNKLSYNEVMYSAFLDELEKLGFDLSGMDKEAILGMGAIGKGIKGLASKGVAAMTPSSVTAARALKNPAMTATGQTSKGLIGAGKARQLAPAAPAPMNPMAQASRARTANRMAGARQSMSPAIGVHAGV